MWKKLSMGWVAVFLTVILCVPHNGLAKENASATLKLPENIAKVNGVEIPSDHVRFEFNRIMDAMPETPSVAEQNKIIHAIIDKEIVRELVHQEGTKKNITIDDKDIQSHMAELKKGYKSDAEWTEALKARDIDENTIRESIKTDLAARKLLEDRVRGKIKITDAQVKNFYEENLSRFQRPEAYKVQHIFIAYIPAAMRANTPQDKLMAQADELRAKARKRIAKIQKELEDGGDFAELAKKYSEDGGSAANGGNLDYIYKGVFDKSFDEAVEGLKKGEVSDIVETRFGYHIIKLNETKPAETAPFDEVKEPLQRHLFTEAAKDIVSNYVNALRKKADIEVMYQP